MEEHWRREGETLLEYDLRIRKVFDEREPHFTKSYKTRHIYYYIQKNIKKMGIHLELFSHIVKELNMNVAERVLNYEGVKLPAGMGLLYVSKLKVHIIKEGNRYRSSSKVDWKKTKEFWFNDEEAMKNKILIYHNGIGDEVFRFSHSRIGCRVHNLLYYTFRPHRRVKLLMQNLDGNNIIFEQ